MAIAAYTKACSKNVAGNIPTVYLAEKPNVTSVTVVAGEITVITMGTGKKFFSIQADLDSVVRSEEGTGTGLNISYVHKVEMKFAKPSTALNTLRNSLNDASPCGILAVVKDGNGTYWLVGHNATDVLERPLMLKADSVNSGSKPSEEDGNKVTISLECESGYPSLPFAAASVASILTAIL